MGMAFSTADYVTFLAQLRPTALLALPSFLVTLAEHIAALKKEKTKELTSEHIKEFESEQACGDDVEFDYLSTCITGGEMMLPAMQDRIRRSLGISRFLSTGYTSNETGAIAFPCAHLAMNHFHIHENMQSVSISTLEGTDVDAKADGDGGGDGSGGGDVGEGRRGRLITSNLNRTLMPVVRYDIGDSGRLLAASPAACRCGRRLRVMQLCGRWDDRVRLGAFLTACACVSVCLCLCLCLCVMRVCICVSVCVSASADLLIDC
jgi:phenylacetate-coenzyme A ligase PaaK-like adenylate-forming protein